MKYFEWKLFYKESIEILELKKYNKLWTQGMGLVAEQTSLREFLKVDDRDFPDGPMAGT